MNTITSETRLPPAPRSSSSSSSSSERDVCALCQNAADRTTLQPMKGCSHLVCPECISRSKGTCTACNTCTICLCDITDATQLDGCSHQFCKDCIVRWCQLSSVCPTCKKNVSRLLQNGTTIETVKRRAYRGPDYIGLGGRDPEDVNGDIVIEQEDEYEFDDWLVPDDYNSSDDESVVAGDQYDQASSDLSESIVMQSPLLSQLFALYELRNGTRGDPFRTERPIVASLPRRRRTQRDQHSESNEEAESSSESGYDDDDDDDCQSASDVVFMGGDSNSDSSDDVFVHDQPRRSAQRRRSSQNPSSSSRVHRSRPLPSASRNVIHLRRVTTTRVTRSSSALGAAAASSSSSSSSSASSSSASSSSASASSAVPSVPNTVVHSTTTTITRQQRSRRNKRRLDGVFVSDTPISEEANGNNDNDNDNDNDTVRPRRSGRQRRSARLAATMISSAVIPSPTSSSRH